MKISTNWFTVENVTDVPSPALLVYPDRIRENIRRMVAIAGGPQRLRPHMKTHKMAEVIRLQIEQGVNKFKCATIAEAELTAGAGAAEVLLSYPLVGPNVGRFLQLIQKFPATKFATGVDDTSAAQALSKAATAAKLTVEVFLDIDCGMHRTGVMPGPKAVELYRLIATLPALKPGGLHAYDGHIHDKELATRTQRVEEAYASVNALRQELIKLGLPVPHYIASGTPTFPVHAKRGEVECSPGTCVLWDAGYGTKCPDMDFLHAALVLTRVVSKPGENRLTLDLGHKAIAAENPHPRVIFLNLPDAKAVMHSEEHLVVETAQAHEFAVGDCIYGVPWHICPTVALHSQAVVIEKGRATARWKVAARERQLTI